MNEEKMTLKESVRLTLRAWCFYWKNTPRFVLSTVLWALADAVSPYAWSGSRPGWWLSCRTRGTRRPLPWMWRGCWA